MAFFVIATKNQQADRDLPEGPPLLRTVTVGQTTKTVVCLFQNPWTLDAANAAADQIATRYSIPRGALEVIEVTKEVYTDIWQQAAGPYQQAQKALRDARETSVLAEADAVLDSLNFSADPTTRDRQLKVLAYALSSVLDPIRKEIVEGA